MALLTCRELALGYESREVLRGLSFTVEAGDFLCVVGDNGAGKSTLIKTVLGLQPQLSGEILHGDDLRPNEIGYLPQQTVVQRDFPASVREIVLSGCQGRCGARPFYNREEKRLAADAMERMGLSELTRRCYRELSGGQQQRVLLARALCATRRLLLLDEPASGLDPHGTAEIYRLLSELNRRDGVAVMMVSHDMGALQYANRILHIGRTLFFGERSDYLSSDIGRAFTAVEGGEA